MEHILDESKVNFTIRKHNKPIKYIIEDECWINISHSTNNAGYPRVYRNGKKEFIHRYIYIIYNGEIPKGMVIRHKCDNIKCINPEHLILGTHYDNVHDKIERGRENPAKGERVSNAKLTEDKVKKIIYMYFVDKEKQKDISKEVNISQNNISTIVNFKGWKHVVIPYYNQLKNEGKIL